MRRTSVFWGGILVLMGLVFLLDNFGYFDSLGVSIWVVFWPLVLILLGLSFLWSAVFGRREGSAGQLAIPLEGAEQAHIRLHHGAGRLRISSGAAVGSLLEATCGGGIDCHPRKSGETLNVELRVPPSMTWVFPWNWFPGRMDCALQLNPETKLSFDINTGASDNRFDLQDLQVKDIHLQTGASSTYITLPANAGYTQARIEAGAASVSIRVPQGVAAKVQFKSGLSGIHIDTSRFPRAGSLYQSSDYESMSNRVDIYIETGVGSINIR